MYIMTQAPEKGKEPYLPHGQRMANTYTEMATGSRCVTIVIKNQTAAPILIVKGVKVTQVVAVISVSPVESYAWNTGKVGQNAGSLIN